MTLKKVRDFGIVESATPGAPVAQLDRATDYESVGRGFKSLRAYQLHLISFFR